MAGAKLATAYFELIPSMAGSQKGIASLLPALNVAGSKGGTLFSKSFATSTSKLSANGIKSLEADVARASSAVAQSRLRELDATGKVRVATAALDQVTTKYGATSVRTIAAQEKLATAQRNLGATHLSLLGNTTKLTTAQGALAKAQESGAGSAGRFRTAFANVSESFGGAFQTGMSAAITAVQGGLGIILGAAGAGALAVTATVGAAFDAGFTRLSTIETAQAKLKALGNTQATIAEIMKDANTAVLSTQYSLADAVTAAANATAAGIQPGADLTSYLHLQANAAALAGVQFSDLGLVMNQVQSQDKAYTQDLNQVASRGIPIYQSLAKVYGTTIGGLRKMLQDGDVDAAHFRAALTLNVGNAADEVGKTTMGSFENMKAAFSRFGAVLVGPIFPLFARAFTGVITALDGMKGSLKPIVDEYGPKLLTIFEPAMAKIGPGFASFVRDITKAANSPEGKKWFSDMGDALTKIGKALVEALPSIVKFAEQAGKLVAALVLLGAQAAPAWIHGAKQISDAGTLVAKNLETVTKSISDGTFWDKVGAKFAHGGKQVTDVAGNFWVGLELKFVQGGVQIQSGMDSLWTGIKSTVDGSGVQINASAASFWAQLAGRFANGGRQINAGASTAWAGIVGAFANGGAQINAGAGGAWAGVVGAFANGGAQINAGAHGAWAGVMGAFANGGVQIGGFTSRAVGSVLGSFANGWSQMVGGARGAWGAVVGAFSNGVSQIRGFFSGAAGWLTSAGADMVHGLIGGIAGAIGGAVSAAANVAKQMIGAAKAALGIQSPSTVFHQLGVYTMQGFTNGINASRSGVDAAVRAAVAVPAYAAAAAGSGAAGRGGPSVWIDKIVPQETDPRVSGRIIGREIWRVGAGLI